jgi:hypothetical protein
MPKIDADRLIDIIEKLVDVFGQMTDVVHDCLSRVELEELIVDASLLSVADQTDPVPPVDTESDYKFIEASSALTGLMVKAYPLIQLLGRFNESTVEYGILHGFFQMYQIEALSNQIFQWNNMMQVPVRFISSYISSAPVDEIDKAYNIINVLKEFCVKIATAINITIEKHNEANKENKDCIVEHVKLLSDELSAFKCYIPDKPLLQSAIEDLLNGIRQLLDSGYEAAFPYLLSSSHESSYTSTPGYKDAKMAFIRSDAHSETLLISSNKELQINGKWLFSHLRYLLYVFDIPAKCCKGAYEDEDATSEDWELAYKMYESYVSAVNHLRDVLGKVKAKDIIIKWKSGTELLNIPDIPVPEVINRK